MSGARIGSLFSGYGGLDSAVRSMVGGELAWWSDIDDGAIRIMSHHHPDAPNIGDIAAVDWAAVEPVAVLTGGFPCQDISAAGKRAGIRPGTRSGLWTQMAYAISRLRPRLVVIENVRNIVNAPAHSDVEPCPLCVGDPVRDDVLRALGAVLGDLADLGFDADWYGLPASGVGACHERWREFVVAYPAGEPWGEWDGDGGAAADAGPFGWGRRTPVLGRPSDDAPWGRAGPLLGTPRVGGYAASAAQTARGSDKGRLEQQIAMLPTPRGTDHHDSLTAPGARRHVEAGNGTLTEVLGSHLLPTPRASDGEKGGPNQRGSSGDLMLPSAVVTLPTPTARDWKNVGDPGKTAERMADRGQPLGEVVVNALLPTPAVNDMGAGKTVEQWDEWTAKMKAKHHNGNGHGDSLSIAAQRVAVDWGKYEAGIRRHERAFGRSAPAPVQPSSKGTPQLAPAFSEWMMGLPLGHVTDPAIWDGMTDAKGRPASAAAIRNAQLKALGNGVVPAQAAAALRVMASWEVAA